MGIRIGGCVNEIRSWCVKTIAIRDISEQGWQTPSATLLASVVRRTKILQLAEFLSKALRLPLRDCEKHVSTIMITWSAHKSMLFVLCFEVWNLGWLLLHLCGRCASQCIRWVQQWNSSHPCVHAFSGPLTQHSHVRRTMATRRIVTACHNLGHYLPPHVLEHPFHEHKKNMSGEYLTN